MTRNARFLPVLAVALVAMFVLAACGDDDDSGAKSSDTTAAVTATTAAATTTLDSSVVVNATLTGAAEAPQPGDVDGSGRAKITLDPAKGEVCFELQVSNIDKPTAAHIHKGPAGVAGNIVVGLAPPAEGSATGCTKAEAAVISDIASNPSSYYVNVHNAAYEKGAIRGQLSR